MTAPTDVSAGGSLECPPYPDIPKITTATVALQPGVPTGQMYYIDM
jgi:hypothetical protein